MTDIPKAESEFSLKTSFAAKNIFSPPVSFEISPQDLEKNLQIFIEKVENEPSSQRILWLEMGLNSDNPQIFYHCLERIISKKHDGARAILAKLLQNSFLDENKKNAAWVAWMKLEYFRLSPQEKIPWLQKVFFDVTAETHKNFFLWCVQEYGEYGNASDDDALIPLQSKIWLAKEIELTRHKMVINTWFESPLERYIEATHHDNFLIRQWGLFHLANLESKEAANYLRLLYEQNSVISGRFTFAKIKEALNKHQFLFPQFHQSTIKN